MREDLTINIRKILDFYSSLGKEQIFNDNRHCNGNCDVMVYDRLERAAFNQADNNAPATCSRYAIWAADVREIINDAIKDLDNNNIEFAKGKMVLALNAIGAYIDVQSLFDSQPGGMEFDSSEDIIKKYSTFRLNGK